MKRLLSKSLFLVLRTAVFVSAVIFITTCVTNPFTGKRTMALVDSSSLLASSFSQYSEFLNESTVITGTADAAMVSRVGNRIRLAAEKWAQSIGQRNYLDNYRWEYTLVKSNEINAWCMPGGKIVVYTGILPVTKDETGLAVVLGHEVAHALLNHGQQRVSADVLQQVGGVGVSVLTSGSGRDAQELAMLAYGAGSTLLGTLPFSRTHESEADHIGLILMAVGGYNPDLSVNFWERMAKLGGGKPPQFLSTHPSDATRIADLRKWIPEAREKALEIGSGEWG
jgi:predicted Zn-dependent protease